MRQQNEVIGVVVIGYFTHCSGVSIDDSEQVNAGLVTASCYEKIPWRSTISLKFTKMAQRRRSWEFFCNFNWLLESANSNAN